MRSSHGDVECATDQLQIPGRVKSNRSRHPDSIVVTRLLACAGDRRDCFRFQINCANQMILCIRDIQRIAIERHSLRPEKRCTIERAIVLPVGAGADCFNQSAVDCGDHDSVVIRISDEQAIAFLIGENLSRKRQR